MCYGQTDHEEELQLFTVLHDYIKSINGEMTAGGNKQPLFPIKIPYQNRKLLRSHTQEKLENKIIFIWWWQMYSKHYENYSWPSEPPAIEVAAAISLA